MRLDKYLSHMNCGSRKEIKNGVKNGWVTVNGERAKSAAMHVLETDTICWKEKPIPYEKYLYLIINKPPGVITATEDRSQRTVLDLIDAKYQRKNLHPIGRLDKDTTGLLILTDDGDLTHELLSPKKHVEKRYLVVTKNKINASLIKRFEEGIYLENEKIITKPAKVSILDPNRCEVTITEGKFHQVKRMFLACENEVLSLQRIAMNGLFLPNDLELGKARKLTKEEFDQLTKGILRNRNI